MLRERAQPALREGHTSPSYWAISIHRLLRKKIGVTCLVIIAIMYGSGILAPLVTPYDYNDQDLSITKQSPSLSHPFGTDRLGRDNLTRIIYGLRTTVIITVVTLVTGSLALGITLGLVAGYFGRFIDTLIMRVGEVSSAFPEIFLVLIIVSTFKPPITRWVREVEDLVGFDIVSLGVVDYLVLSLALAIFSWFGMARLVRGQVLQARENQYVEAARSIGASTPRILLRHLLPNVMSPVIVTVSAGLAAVAGSEVLISFLGIGIQPPTPSLGLMIFENGSISVLRSDPHLLLFPVLTLSLLLFTFNLLGDAVADAFNPRAR
ncbi:MAG: ABC transporter permease [Dehalococcoidia bacterium]|jgi:ABC-type dipeptide/oligopeptide/nickel transport system permease subunit|nr:ABC transporter permease [Dehalococcoidia bacterium]MCS5666311.1 ABC transporter permease [Dehalococcoidia bacterium]MQF67248.1 ABC transporter permease [SAR202 cluster bacterium AD-802-F09_MRT_200m]|tara:strand:- start:185 stop:1147 length:963 start_codon:yes stop_codon:yes gene_type:complete